MTCRSRLTIALVLLANLLVGPLTAWAQTTPTPASGQTLNVQLQPAIGETVTGLAILGDAGAATTVQLLVLNAPSETVAMIQPGTCTEIDPTPVGLLGTVGATGQIQTTVPIAFATIATGGYVIALHAGLSDLATALACGDIPAVPTGTAAPTAAVTPSATTGGNEGATYESPSYGYTLTLGDEWQIADQASSNRIDTVVLTNRDGISVVVIGRPGFDGDPRACLEAWSTVVDQRQQANELSDVAPYQAVDGAPVSGEETDRAWTTLQYEAQSRVSMPALLVEYHECRRFTPVEVIEIAQNATPDAYPAAAAAREALLATLVLPAGVSSRRPTALATVAPLATEPAPTIAAAPPAEPTVAPTPTINVACNGFSGFYTGVIQQLGRFSEMLTELGKAQQTGDLNRLYLIYLDLIDELETLVPSLSEAAAPTGFQELYGQFVAAMTRYQTALVRYIDGLENISGRTVAEMQALNTELGDAFTELARVSRQIETFAKDCGVTTTTT